MTLPHPPIDRSPEPQLRVSWRTVDDTAELSDELATCSGPPTPRLRPVSEAEQEQSYLVDLRYQQHLAQQALQELFESGALGILEI